LVAVGAALEDRRPVWKRSKRIGRGARARTSRSRLDVPKHDRTARLRVHLPRLLCHFAMRDSF